VGPRRVDGPGEAPPARRADPRDPTRALVAGGVVALTALAWFLPPPAGLSVAGLRVLATLAGLVALGFADVLPDHLLGLLMVAAWVVTGTLPVEVAAGFAGSTWFLLLASMAVGAAVARSGLLYRGAIELVRRLPASHRVRCLTLGGLGALFSAGMPSPPDAPCWRRRWPRTSPKRSATRPAPTARRAWRWRPTAASA
jgi:di/tricarboxylate transporter